MFKMIMMLIVKAFWAISIFHLSVTFHHFIPLILRIGPNVDQSVTYDNETKFWNL